MLLLHSLTHSEGQHRSLRLRGSKLQKSKTKRLQPAQSGSVVTCSSLNLAYAASRVSSFLLRERKKPNRTLTESSHFLFTPGGGRDTLIYGLYRYVPRDRLWFLRFSILKLGNIFTHVGVPVVILR